MPTGQWIFIAATLALAAALAAFWVVSGFPADGNVAAWPMPPGWTPPEGIGRYIAAVAVLLAALASIFLVFQIIAGTWKGLAYIAEFIIVLSFTPTSRTTTRNRRGRAPHPDTARPAGRRLL